MDKEYTMDKTVPWPFELVRRRQQRTSHGRKWPLNHSASDSEAKPSAEKSLSRFPPSGAFWWCLSIAGNRAHSGHAHSLVTLSYRLTPPLDSAL